MKPAGIILAGGRSVRMGGGDKCLLPLQGQPMLDHVIGTIRPQLGALALNANGDASRFSRWGLPVLADGIRDSPGPLAGVLAGMRWAAAMGCADIISVPADTPFLPGDLVARLWAARGTAPIACAASGGRMHGVVALWAVALADRLEAALRGGERKVAAFSMEQGMVAVDFPARSLFNVNRPEDLSAAHQNPGVPHV